MVAVRMRMSIDIQLYIISGGLVVLSGVAAWQAFRLRAVYRSKASWIGMVTFILLGLQRLYGFYGLKKNIAKSRLIIEDAKAKGVNLRGVNLDRLSPEQWVGIAWSIIVLLGFIAWQHWQHRDLRRIGVLD